MERITTAVKANADVAKGVVDSTAINVIEAIKPVITGKGESGMDDRQLRIFASMRNKLFMKYVGMDYEVVLSRNFRDDVYSELKA